MALLDQGYRTHLEAVLDGYAAMAGWWLAGENRRNWRETFSTAISSTTNLTWCHPRLKTGLLGEKPSSSRLRYGTALISDYIRQFHQLSTPEDFTRIFIHWKIQFMFTGFRSFCLIYNFSFCRWAASNAVCIPWFRKHCSCNLQPLTKQRKS